ncbi:RusA family crossover junction endodeoxyribonuclease [Gordonia alkanivorans]|uniref:RusA family crossover junction endodeoxyribonuclease n=1 Tax=Gordonia alkanivorans TaxID=84096 RepID=UPI000694531F|nr:RusA family crossover junction endodeoxyribonuclease [Gordonia alkanivorans]
MSVDAQAMLDAGTHRLCNCGQWVIRASQAACKACVDRQQPSSEVVSEPMPGPGRGPRTAPATIADKHLGGFAGLPDHTLWLIIAGTPVPQGSMRAIAAGVVAHDKGPALTQWRNAIHRAFLKSVGVNFRTPDCPMRLHVCLTMPGPSQRAPGRTIKQASSDVGRARVAPDTKPDLDKLVRAVGDALDPKGERTRSYADDGRIVELMSAKTFPRPEHVHDWALPEPGVVIRIAPAHVDASFPPVSLAEPGVFPEAAVHTAGLPNLPGSLTPPGASTT